MGGRALAAAVSTERPYVYSDAGRTRDRGRRLRVQALDPAPACRRRRGRDRLPARRDPRRARTLRRRAAFERPGRSRAAGRTRSRSFASSSGACRSSASASATSCLRSPPATRRSSFRSATAARTTRCSSARLDVCSSRVRTTALPSPRPSAREATYVSLYDDTVEGLSFPLEHARSVQFHPEAGPGPHDAWPLLERWVEEVAYAEAA